jgi:hypothetical protein
MPPTRVVGLAPCDRPTVWASRLAKTSSMEFPQRFDAARGGVPLGCAREAGAGVGVGVGVGREHTAVARPPNDVARLAAKLREPPGCEHGALAGTVSGQ